MATLLELYAYASTPEYVSLRQRIAVACAIKAKAIGDLETPAEPQIAWAKATLHDPDAAARDITHYVVAANSTATIAQINAATDAQVQTAVNTAVNTILSL